MAGSSTTKQLPPQHQVFINFRGADVRYGFVSHLVKALTSNNINVYNYDNKEDRGEPIETLLKRIEESRIALVILSESYTESRWCLTELVRIKDCVEKGKLVAIPIFYKVDPSTVRYQMGQFGDSFRHLVESNAMKKKEWKNAMKWISSLMGIIVKSYENERIELIVVEVKRVLKRIQEASVDPLENIETEISAGGNKTVEGVKEVPSEENQETSVTSSENIETKISDVLPVTRPAETVFFPAMTVSSTVEQPPPQHQVFINVQGKLRYEFVNRIVEALVRDKINVFIDKDEGRCQRLEVPMTTIEESRIALVIFSKEYTESGDRLKELVKIADCVEKGKLVAIPVFYKLGQFTMDQLASKSPNDMWKKLLMLFREKPDMRDLRESETPKEMSKKYLKLITEKPCNLRDLKEREAEEMWKKSLKLITEKPGIVVDNMSSEKETLKKLVDEVKSVLNKIPLITFTNSPMDGKVKPPQIQVFISFRGSQLRNNFIGYLVDALRRSEINVFIDTLEQRGEDLNKLFKSIEDSGIAIVVFSSSYTESKWCLEELVKINERAHQGLLKVLPIFYKVTPDNVKQLKGEFGDHFRDKEHKYASDEAKIKRWKEAIVSVSDKFALTFDEKSGNEADFINSIVKQVKIVITWVLPKQMDKYSHDYWLSELQEDASMDSSSSEDLKGVDVERDDGILSDKKSDRNPKEAEIVQPEGKSRRDDGLNPSKDDNFLGETNSDATSKLKNSGDFNKVDAVNEEKKQENVGESSTMVIYDKPLSEHPEVFINFRGADLRHCFVDHVTKALKRDGVNVYIDVDELAREDLTEFLFKRIEESRIALVIFSQRYTESRWFLNKLVKIKELMDEGKLLVIPIFYKVEQLEVTQLKGDFGVKFWNLWRINRDNHIIKWKEALESFASSKGIYLKEHGSESELITLTVKEVLERVSLQRRENPPLFLSTEKGKNTDLPMGEEEKHETYLIKCHLFGMEQRMEQLERKLEFDCKETRIIGVVGMPGIGKTALAMMLHEKWSCKFIRSVPLLGIRKKSEQYEPEWLRKTLLEVLLEGILPEITDKTTHEFVKVELLQKKIFAVLDDVSNKKQLDFLLGDLGWIKKGSKIVITTCDKSLLEGLSHDTYVVPQLNYKESFQLFTYHAFDQIFSPTKIFNELSRMFVEYTRGHPLALKVLGRELCGRDKAHWEKKLEILTESSNMLTQLVWRFSIDQLNDRQKDVFQDIVCFFNSEDEYFVRSLLDSGDHDSNDAVSEVINLSNKFLITISDGRIEMNHLLYMLGKDLSSPEQYRRWNCKDINMLIKMDEQEANNVRGIFLDMSEIRKSIALDCMVFAEMLNLRYLKIYDSCCPRRCKATCNLYFPDGVEFPLEEVRYLHWVKFPLKEIPADFRPKNLVDLRLPYSMIERVWKGVKYTPRLKWVDLSHSSKLLDLSALSKAENLQRLNLEGCTSLDELPVEIQNMKSLVFLNLRGCICLCYLPKMNLISLKTLILSDCSNLEEFELISESVEFLHLDGTAIKGLPLTIQNLQRLVVLNLKNCKMLECLPKCLGELKGLEELILSGCSRLKNLPDVRDSMKHLQSLLIDRIGAKEMPNISCVNEANNQASIDMSVEPMGPSKWPLSVNGVSTLRRLCLSGNDFVSLQPDIEKLYNLKWLDVKHCKKLRCVPMLPPRLQYFDAHGCDSLERVANPLADPMLSEQIHATFSFSNCYNLDQDAKDSIISYIRLKSQLMLDELTLYDGGFVLEALIGTCFPGWEVPAWFSYQASGSMLEPKLPSHWCDDTFTGIALCAVILLPEYHDQRKRVIVECNCEFKNKDGLIIHFSYTVGGWSDSSNTPRKIESSHVFIGFTSLLHINKISEEDDEEKCFSTETSIKFQVTDGTGEIKGSEVLKCGFSFLYAPEERRNIWSDSTTLVIPESSENISGEGRPYGNSRSHDDIQHEPYSGRILGRDESFSCEAKSDVPPNLQESIGNNRVDLLNEESNAGGDIIVSSYHDNTRSGSLKKQKMHALVGVEQRLKQMEKVLYLTPGKTRIVGLVGMPGIGKTTLATILFEKRGCKFPSHLFLTMPTACRLEQLRRVFLTELLKHGNQDINDNTTHESVKDKLLQNKVFVVLNGVRDKKQLKFLLGNLNWIKNGSKIVITTCDKSLLEGLAHDTYVVQQLNNQEAFQLLTYHAFYNQICPSETFISLCRMFVDYAAGNPLALKLLGSDLCGKEKTYWEQELQRWRQSFDTKMRNVWRFSIDQLNVRQADVFLDIVYFFKSEDEYFVRSLLDPEAMSELRELTDKFLITISGGRVEMHDQLHTLGKDLGSPGKRRLQNYKDIINMMTEMKQSEANNVRGIFLDMSEIRESIALDCMVFTEMLNLRYLKIYDSCCPRRCKATCNLYFPDGVEFPLEEVRYLHWVKFPLKEIPADFRPKNLVDLRLPYSMIERVWKGVKDTPRLKWVDLSHSSKLLDLSALSKAENLQRLNLEGCTSLDELPVEIQNMKSLVFLNLRGCICLCYLPKMNLISLKTLILSDCSNLEEFELISESVEFLHLDGTAIKGLPLTIQNLQRLVVLNLKNCKMLECLPKCLGELKALEELILSGCSRLKNLPDVRESMKHLQSLLIDRIGAKEMPNISCVSNANDQASIDMSVEPMGPRKWPLGVNGVSTLRRLCLSGNDFVSLQPDIEKLYNLKWLDVKHCKKLRCVPMLPPRLQYFDAHGCDSLERVANPLADPMLSEQIHATFSFSNCYNLNQDAKDNIVSYIRLKSQLMLDELSRYNTGLVLEVLIGTCFPGWEVPSWFIHHASGSELNLKLPPHWCDNRFTGICLCAVIVFHGNHYQRKHVLVKCNFKFKNEDGSIIRFSCSVGGWSEPSDTPRKIESSHVFIGFTSLLHINKIAEEDDEEKCFSTETSIKFQVTDGTEEIKGSEVLKCGFSLLYAPEERRNICRISKTCNSKGG